MNHKLTQHDIIPQQFCTCSEVHSRAKQSENLILVWIHLPDCEVEIKERSQQWKIKRKVKVPTVKDYTAFFFYAASQAAAEHVPGEARWLCSNRRIPEMGIKESLECSHSSGCPLWLERLRWQQWRHQIIPFFMLFTGWFPYKWLTALCRNRISVPVARFGIKPLVPVSAWHYLEI